MSYWSQVKRRQRAARMIMGLTSLLACASAPAAAPAACEAPPSAQLTLDQGHPWRAPFGLERVGSPLIAHVAITSESVPRATYALIAYHGTTVLKRQPLQLSINPHDYGGYGDSPTLTKPGQRFAHVSLSSETTEVALESRCEGRTTILERRAVTREELEAEAIATSPNSAHPVDLGTIFPPHNGLLMQEGESATVEFAALSNAQDLPSTRLTVWFGGSKAFVKPLALPKGQRITESITLPLPSSSEKTTLHVRLIDAHEKTLFSKDIRVMVGAKKPWPVFGAIEMKLRYDAPIPSFDPRSGAARASIAYDTAWDEKLQDIVVFLPNGSRFVFWRGANYIPFWAGRYNTGTLYQWAEDCNRKNTNPDGSHDCPEPLFDSELRFSRVRLIESTSARIHVRWDYQPTDVRYELTSGRVTEDFYFYPDGFGTRVVTLTAPPKAGPPQLSEFIVVTPAAAYPFEVLPEHPIEVISLNSGRKERFAYPDPRTFQPDPESSATRMARLPMPDRGPALYRVFSHKSDPASAIYLHFNNRADAPTLTPHTFPPMYDRGEIVAPVFWGNHWPLTRGQWNVWAINNQIFAGPTHHSLAVWIPWDPETSQLRFEMPPLRQGQWQTPDCSASDRLCTVSQLAWMIGQTELPDQVLIEQAQSYLHPPILTVTGGRLAVPSYSPERRALRIVAESPFIEIDLKSQFATVNPMFEIEEAPRQLVAISLDGKTLAPKSYRWDGSTLWVGATIPASGGILTLRFQ